MNNYQQWDPSKQSNWLFEKLFKLFKKPPIKPIKDFNDPFSKKIEWTPLRWGWSNFKTAKLVNNISNQISFEATLTSKLFSSVFILIGIMTILSFYLNMDTYLSLTDETRYAFYFVICFWWIFISIGAFMFYNSLTPIRFDKQVWYFWKWRKTPTYGQIQDKKSARLDQIYSIQLISESVILDLH